MWCSRGSTWPRRPGTDASRCAASSATGAHRAAERCAGARLSLATLVHDLRVSPRTLARDVERLRISGVPIHTHRDRGGGVNIPYSGALVPIAFDLPEAAALTSSLAVLAPSVSPSATSAMRKLTAALQSQ